MWSMWVRSLIRLSFCLRNFYEYLRGLRQRGQGALGEASLSYSKDPPKTASAVSIPFDPGGPPHPGGLRDASQRPQTPLRRLKTPPNGPQMPQEASKKPSDGSKTPQKASKRPQRPSKIDFSSQHGPPKPQKTFKIYWKNNSSEPLH